MNQTQKEKKRQYRLSHQEEIKAYNQTPQRKYGKIKRSAKLRKLIFQISLEEYQHTFWKKPCYYCQEEASGIDRVDNQKGYIHDNMVPCCYWCNIAKSNHSQEEFEIKILQIAQTIQARKKLI